MWTVTVISVTLYAYHFGIPGCDTLFSCSWNTEFRIQCCLFLCGRSEQGQYAVCCTGRLQGRWPARKTGRECERQRGDCCFLVR